ncbi:transposase [Ornithinibacillus sp. L9]|uniref:Transposase n=1 Tax=Ornithinibacillus caprae TaxID=2678566 RepID=A0A6N8FJU2_9BACI|nr:transposase [Ornithinibacillus caprae]MUK87568.1 transposase [Ornithinibacillus caprae]
MSRKPRVKSYSGIYHIMMRGINRQTIFEDDQDKIRFIETVKRFKNISNFHIYGYCLMDNHIHLLIKENDEALSKAVQRISASYVYWYNNRYDRSGSLFQGRYKSEPVDSLSYFLKVIRYIHQNPLKAGLASNVFECKWTSVNEYFNRSTFLDIEFALHQFSPDRKQAIQMYTDYMHAPNDDECLDDQIMVKSSDDNVKKYLSEIGFPHSSELQKIDKNKRNEIILELKSLKGVTTRQLSRITGISKSVIDRVR